jgi:hypothetical protein
LIDDTQTEASEKKETPEAAASRWAGELGDAKRKLKTWHHRGQEILKRFRDERTETQSLEEKRLNLYTADVQQVMAMLFATVPTADVQRRFADANDGVARVSAELLGRVLNEDLHFAGEDQCLAMKQALSDFIQPGLGSARVRYQASFAQRPALDGLGQPVLDENGESASEEVKDLEAGEEAEVLYTHWRDQLWDPQARVFSELRWWGFREWLTKAKATERFGADVASRLTYKSRSQGDEEAEKFASADGAQAEVWELWDKERGEVCWWSEGASKVLDRRPPPIDLEGFWPFPRPMMANLTTDDLVPTPDFVLAQDQYKQIDKLVTRRDVLIEALKLRGVYDQTCEGVSRMLQEGTEAQLIPVPNWNAFAEKGGVAGAIAWLPLEQVVAALEQINNEIEIVKAEIFEVTGRSDIMRGQQAENGTPGEAQAKLHFASARLNAMAEEFARWCSDLQRLRAEVIAKYFEPETILQRSNAQFTYDAATAAQAVQLIKSGVSAYRICIKSDSMVQTDYAANRQDAVEVLAALGGFIQQAGSVAQAIPGSMPFLLELLRWSINKLKGANEIGGLLDKAIQMAQQPQPQQAPQADPKVQAAQIQNQGKAQQLQMKAQLDAQHMAMETQQLAQRQKDQVAANVTEELAKQRIKTGLGAGAATNGGMP